MSCYEEKLGKIKRALCSAEVAGAAKVGGAEWANHHIFEGIGELFVRGRNRGRLPFVEIQEQESDFEQAAVDGQYESSTWIIRVNVGGSTPTVMRKNADAIAKSFLNLFKEDIQERSGGTSISGLINTPIGGYVEVTMDFEDVDGDYTFNDSENY